MKSFNTTGPCRPDEHYMLPPEERLVGANLSRYLDERLYWVLYAPRQTGKTTFLINWMHELNATSKYVACYVSVEITQGMTDVERAIPLIRESIRKYAGDFSLSVPQADTADPGFMLSNIMGNWAKLVAPKPLIVFFDEVDVLTGDALISFLRQLRGGFASRGVGKFPISVAIVGMRDLKDYITQSKDGVAPNPGSPFNIKKDSILLKNFSEEDVTRLFAQRTAETGQRITQEALDYVWEQSQGQPWIVNNLFDRATTRVLDYRSTETVELKHIVEARRQMIEARETHLDSLVYRMQDAAVKPVVETVISGETNMDLNLDSPGVQQAMDLGLLTFDANKGLSISNPIYTEILTRVVNSSMQIMMPPPSNFKWQKPDGSLDMDSLLQEFQQFWRDNSELWEAKSDYTEAFPHLLLLAFLQRILNGGGRIDREVAAGSGKMDLYVEYHGYKCIMEIKVLRDSKSYERVLEEGLQQIKRYQDRKAPGAPLYLLIFDRRSESKKAAWEERIKWDENEERVTVVGL
ncbi:MAG: PD-(D/E)XK nuclease domain-containing protein [Prevotellaceae bacterium]|nr:PD-(D/E)XK nuclease domain-containing protein [Prevotellaceae bacterium]